MRPADEVLRYRLANVGQPKLIVESLDLQLRLYAEWIASRHESIVKLDNSACGEEALQAFLTRRSKC